MLPSSNARTSDFGRKIWAMTLDGDIYRAISDRVPRRSDYDDFEGAATTVGLIAERGDTGSDMTVDSKPGGSIIRFGNCRFILDRPVCDDQQTISGAPAPLKSQSSAVL